jgi:hypothetical protein
LSGSDAASFTISSDGALGFRTAPDFETPTDSDENNLYEVTIEASDGTASGSLGRVGPSTK